jgi:hypothetical protein
LLTKEGLGVTSALLLAAKMIGFQDAQNNSLFFSLLTKGIEEARIKKAELELYPVLSQFSKDIYPKFVDCLEFYIKEYASRNTVWYSELRQTVITLLNWDESKNRAWQLALLITALIKTANTHDYSEFLSVIKRIRKEAEATRIDGSLLFKSLESSELEAERLLNLHLATFNQELSELKGTLAPKNVIQLQKDVNELREELDANSRQLSLFYKEKKDLEQELVKKEETHLVIVKEKDSIIEMKNEKIKKTKDEIVTVEQRLANSEENNRKLELKLEEYKRIVERLKSEKRPSSGPSSLEVLINNKNAPTKDSPKVSQAPSLPKPSIDGNSFFNPTRKNASSVKSAGSKGLQFIEDYGSLENETPMSFFEVMAIKLSSLNPEHAKLTGDQLQEQCLSLYEPKISDKDNPHPEGLFSRDGKILCGLYNKVSVIYEISVQDGNLQITLANKDGHFVLQEHEIKSVSHSIKERLTDLQGIVLLKEEGGYYCIQSNAIPRPAK